MANPRTWSRTTARAFSGERHDNGGTNQEVQWVNGKNGSAWPSAVPVTPTTCRMTMTAPRRRGAPPQFRSCRCVTHGLACASSSTIRAPSKQSGMPPRDARSLRRSTALGGLLSDCGAGGRPRPQNCLTHHRVPAPRTRQGLNGSGVKHLSQTMLGRRPGFVQFWQARLVSAGPPLRHPTSRDWPHIHQNKPIFVAFGAS